MQRTSIIISYILPLCQSLLKACCRELLAFSHIITGTHAVLLSTSPQSATRSRPFVAGYLFTLMLDSMGVPAKMAINAFLFGFFLDFTRL